MQLRDWIILKRLHCAAFKNIAIQASILKFVAAFSHDFYYFVADT
jgi:hypothetical protein